jgi:chromosomal replication initiator protein
MSQSFDGVWNCVLSSLRADLPDGGHTSWLKAIRPLALSGDALTIAVPSLEAKGGIESRYRDTIERLASSVCARAISLDILVDTKVTSSSPSGKDAMLPRSDATIPLHPEYSFDSFIQGKNNRLAHAASKAVAERLGRAYNPLFIYGSVGLGKTHLLHAIGNYVRSTSRDKAVVYTTSERFAIELINAIRNNATAGFRERYRGIDLLLIDDVHFLEGKEATQEEFFHTFNELYGSEKQIVLTSDRPPEDLSGLQERLVSRFRWGLVADIQPPDLETRIAILREKASQRHTAIDDAVLELIAKRISSNVRALEGALVKALAYEELQGERLTPQTIEGMLPKEGRRPRLTIAHIKEEVASRYGFPVAELEGPSRKKDISQARHIAIYLSRNLMEHSFPAIGKAFGDRDHTTIMHAYSKIKTLVQETPLLQAEVSDIRESLTSRYSTLA